MTNQDITKSRRLRFLKNCVFCLVLIIMSVWLFFTYQANNDLNAKIRSDSNDIGQLKTKLSNIQEENNRTIYLPEDDVSNLTMDQKNSIVLLTDIFSRITTYNNSTVYESNYKYASEYIKDSNFYTEFLPKPRDDANNSVVEMSGLKMDNVRTVVVPIGEDTYRVFVSFIAYHADSDLYQRNALKVTNKIVDVQGSLGQFTKTTIQEGMGANTSLTRVSDIN